MWQEGERSPQPDTAYWRQCVRHWFPRLQDATYFLPPVHMNKVYYEWEQFAGVTVTTPQPPQETPPKDAPEALHLSSVRDDQTQQHLLHCLQKLAETGEEPMFLISQLEFGDYLGSPCYAAAARLLPRPVDLEGDYRRGDFDLLVIHKHYGIVVTEVKTVGESFARLRQTEEQQDALVVNRVKKALKQLKRAGDVLQHLVSDMQHRPVVRKTLMLPYVPRCQLQRVIGNSPHIKTELCQCLDIDETVDPVNFILSADHVSDRDTPWDVTPCVLTRLCDWWTRQIARPSISASDDAYEELVARFAGPATVVKVFCVTKLPLHLRSKGDGVAETSRRFCPDIREIVLHPSQLDVLNMNQPLVYLCGPPGTGKSLVLIVRALDWLSQGRHVHVVSIWGYSLAVSILIHHQIQKSAGRNSQNLHLHVFDFDEEGQMEEAVERLVLAADSGSLCVIMDEAYSVKSNAFAEFCISLHARVRDLRLWVATFYHVGKPSCLTEVAMTHPLRSPPAVCREIRLSRSIQEDKTVRDYTPGPAQPPCDGPTPILVHHTNTHDYSSPLQCELCGGEVARVLRDLHVNITMKGQNGSDITAPLTYRDVFLLTWGDDIQYGVEKSTRGFLRGLTRAGVPVRVVEWGDTQAVRDVALYQGPDEVVVAWSGTVGGLERPVVVFVQSRGSENSLSGRLDPMSRSSAQLVRVVCTS